MLGTKHGDVQPLSTGLTLADRIGVLSNVVQEGESVYAVSGYSTRTIIAARSGGSMRVFQRVGYAGKAVVGGEQFKDTLAVEGKALALELSGVGIITDDDKANALIGILLNEAKARPGETETLSGYTQALTIYLTEGITLQLNVSGDVAEGCGAWSCLRFFTEFKAAVGESK
jgi:hypothetical protein